MSQHLCPRCGGTEFIVPATVKQIWHVNSLGDFESVGSEHVEILKPPSDDESWVCRDCMAEGVILDRFQEESEKYTVEVPVFCDTTDIYSEEERAADPIAWLQFPEYIVRQYFKLMSIPTVSKLNPDTDRCRDFNERFRNWMDEITATDTEGLCSFARYYFEYEPKR